MKHTMRMKFVAPCALLAITVLTLGGQTARAEDDPLKNAPRVNILEFNRAAVNKSLPLLQNTASMFVKQTGGQCFSCHHQSLPSLAIAYARPRGFAFDAQKAKEQTEYVYGITKMLSPLAEKARTSRAAEKDLDMITVDPAISVDYALWGLAADGVKPDAATAAMARYLMQKQETDGRWPIWSARAPMESSEFTTTALAARVLHTYAAPSDKTEAARRIAKARAWLLTAKPKTTEDKAFRLCGLRWTNAGPSAIQTAASALLALQHDDGGWGQTPNAPSDAYATGQTLVALHDAGGMATDSPAYRRGAFFLAATQKEDGSWLVIKRAPPVQRFFESGFPHGNDQFISCAATSWATMALALTLPKTDTAVRAAQR